MISPEVRIALAGWPTDVGWHTLSDDLLVEVAVRVVGDEVDEVDFLLLRHLFRSYPDVRGFYGPGALTRRLLAAERWWKA